MFAPILAVLLAQYPATAKPVPKAYAKGFATIIEADARMLVAKLAGPDFMGRGPGQPGFDAAAQFASDWFRKYGLAPAGDDGTYFQKMFLSHSVVDAPTVHFEGADLAWEKDFTFGATGNVHLKSKLAFVHFDGTAELSTADKAKLKGRIVILDPAATRRNPARRALEEAQDAGTLGAVAIVGPVVASNLIVPTARFTHNAADPAALTDLRMSQEAAAKLAQAAGAIRWMAGNPGVEAPDLEIGLNGDVKVTDELATMNVVAKLEGSDAKLKSEAVVIGSHLDHFGTSDKGTFWGADDNGSGSSANMMIARAFAQNGVRPKRTMVFCLWTMEEKGLLGSRFYTLHPSVPLADTIAYLNMDMVGRDSDNPDWTDRAKENTDAAYASSAKVGSPELYALVKEANRAVGLNLRDDREDRTMRSDTGSFARVGIPVLKAFTGEHPDYHKMTDTPEKLNYPKMARVVQWVYLCGQELANVKTRPAYSTTGRYVRGRVRAAADTELPADAVIEVTLLEDGRAIDSEQMVNTGHLPQIFTLRYDLAKLDSAKSYTVTARVVQGGKVLMGPVAAISVLGKDSNSNSIEVLVEAGK